jgi:ribosomal protein S7
VKSRQQTFLKIKIINSLMKNGEKKTGEKILLKSVKSLQKSISKNSKDLIRLAIVNSTSTFKLNEQVIKKGKRKAMKRTPSFIINDSLRITTSLKTIKKVVSKAKETDFFYERLAKEILSSSQLKGQVIDTKNDLQKQILLNKRYLSKFRW